MTGEALELPPPENDQATLEMLRESGFVPWATFEREQRWREDLQRQCALVFEPLDEGLGSHTWPRCPEDVTALRAQIEELHAEIERQQARLETARNRTQAEVHAMQSAIADARADEVACQLPPPPEPGSLLLDEYLQQCTRGLIEFVLSRTPNKTEAAEALGMGRSTLYRRMAELGIE